MKNITLTLLLCLFTCFAEQVNAQELSEVSPIPKEVLKTKPVLSESKIQALDVVYETLHDFTSYVTISPTPPQGLSDGAVLAGTNRFIKRISVRLYDIDNVLDPYDVTINLFTDCNTDGTSNSNCSSGPGVLVPGSTQTITVTPATRIHEVTFSFDGLDLSNEADNEIAVVLNTPNNDTGWLTGVGGRSVGSRTAAETGFGADTYSRCGASSNSCNFWFGAPPANPRAILDLKIEAVPSITPPSLTCPATTVENNTAGSCEAVVTFAGMANDIEDGDISGDIIANPASGSTFPVGNTTVTLTVTDSDGNTATCDFIVTVEDTEAPMALCQNLTVVLDPVTSTATITAADIDNGSTDNCNIDSFAIATAQDTQSELTTSFSGGTTQGGNMFDIEPLNDLTINSFDVHMSTNQTQTVEVYFKTGTWVGSENTAADWTLVGTATVTSRGTNFPTPLDLDLDIEVVTGERVAFYVTSSTGSLRYSGGTTVGNIFASDANLNIYEGCAKSYPFGTTFQPRNFNGNIVYTITEINPFSGVFDCNNIGSNEIILQVTDEAGNVSNCISTVTVQDVTSPVITCKTDVFDVTLDTNGMASLDPMTLIDSVDDDCDYTITPTSGGPTASSITTTFLSNNGGSASYTVLYDITVGENDIEITDIDIHTTSTAAFNLDLYTLEGTFVGNETDAAAWGAPAATGTGTGMGRNIPSNAMLDAPVTLSANTTYGIAIVVDVSVLYINGTGCPGNQCYDNGEISLSLGSAVSGTFTGTVFNPRVWNGSINYNITLPHGLNFTCADVGENQVEITATDSSGNTTSCFATVNVIDDIAPVITCLAGVEFELGADGTANVDPATLIDTVDDLCGIGTSAVDVSEVNCDDIGAPVPVTVFVSDAYGNLASCMTEITVVDKLGPELTCPEDQTVRTEIGSTMYVLPDYFATGEAVAIDNCTDPVTIFTQNPAAGSQLPIGTHTITLTAEDEYGNISTCTFELKVDPALGVDSNNLDSGITLYPNPANNVVNLTNNTNLVLQKMKIFDINGKLVNQVDLQNMQGQKLVDISLLASGVYIVQINSESASTVKRLIKK